MEVVMWIGMAALLLMFLYYRGLSYRLQYQLDRTRREIKHLERFIEDRWGTDAALAADGWYGNDLGGES